MVAQSWALSKTRFGSRALEAHNSAQEESGNWKMNGSENLILLLYIKTFKLPSVRKRVSKSAFYCTKRLPPFSASTRCIRSEECCSIPTSVSSVILITLHFPSCGLTMKSVWSLISGQPLWVASTCVSVDGIQTHINWLTLEQTLMQQIIILTGWVLLMFIVYEDSYVMVKCGHKIIFFTI